MRGDYQSIKNGYCEDVKSASVLRLVLLGICVITPAITPDPSVNIGTLFLSASIGSIATPVGNFFTGIVIDRYGRKPALMLGILPSIVGWSILALVKSSLTWLYVGQLLTGFALGAASLPSSVYAAECITINHNNLRGSLTTWTTLALSGGTVLVYVLGSLLSYDKVALVSAALSVLSLALITFYIPESPLWLYNHGRLVEAERSQRCLGIRQPLLSNKRVRISATKAESSSSSSSVVETVAHYVENFRRKDIYKPLLITVTLLFSLQFSGIYVLTAYMVNIVNWTGVYYTSVNPYLLVIVAGVINFVSVALITFIIPRSGIRRLLILSSGGVALGMFSLSTSLIIGCYFFVSVCAVWTTVLMAGLGFTAIPYSVLGEIFPTDGKSFASISLIASSAFNFVVLKTYPYLALALGHGVFYVYAAFSLFGTIFVTCFLPETVGKSMQEITDEFVSSAPTLDS